MTADSSFGRDVERCITPRQSKELRRCLSAEVPRRLGLRPPLLSGGDQPERRHLPDFELRPLEVNAEIKGPKVDLMLSLERLWLGAVDIGVVDI